MKALSIVLTLLLGVGFLASAIWLSKSPSVPANVSTKTPVRADPPEGSEPIPVVATTGPYPKAVAVETEHDFGTMPLYGEGTHQFVIKNEGEAPLEVVAREIDTTCQCTVGKVADGVVPPGGETTVELKWEIKAAVPKFRHTAKIRTNDPKNSVIEMAITGKIDKEFNLLPDALWDLGESTGTNPASASGVLFSRIKKDFTLSEFVCANPRIQCTWVPLEQAELAEHEALSGYKLTITADLNDTSGTVKESVSLQTTDSEIPAARFDVKASRPGPVEIMARSWDAAHSTLMLGEFAATTGKTAELSFFVRVPEEVQLLSAESEHQAVKATWTQDAKYQAKSNAKRYLLKLEILPGPPAVRRRDDAEKVRLKFDHPQLGEMTIFVSYLST